MTWKKITTVATIFVVLGVVFILAGTFVCVAIADVLKKISGEER